jgi:hypothetical protein
LIGEGRGRTIPTFYKQKTYSHAPYRELSLEYHNNVLRVGIIGGEQWGQENARDLKTVQGFADFDAGLQAYAKEWLTLIQDGWKAYDPRISDFV